MSDLIDRQAAIDALLTLEFVWDDGLSDVEKEELDYAIHGMIMAYKERIELLPSAQPERKTGKWIQKGLKWECDQCGCRIGRAKPFSGNMWNYYYCPNCGVKMEEGEQDGQTN